MKPLVRDRCRLDLVIYGAMPLGGAICCDATLVSPLRRDGAPHAGAPARDGAVLQMAERRKRATYPELAQKGRSVPLRAGMRNWRTLERLSNVACAAPGRAVLLPGRTGRARPWARRWWSVRSTAVQQAIGHTALGRARAVPGPSQSRLAFNEVMALAPADSVSRLPLR